MQISVPEAVEPPLFVQEEYRFNISESLENGYIIGLLDITGDTCKLNS